MQLRTKGFDKLRKDLQNFQKDTTRVVDRELRSLTREGANVAKAHVPTDRGDLESSIQTLVESGTGKIFTDLPYAGYQEFGTKTLVRVPPELQEEANKFRNQPSPGGFAQFRENILSWMGRHSIPEQALWPIMAKILTTGIAPQPFMYPAFNWLRANATKRLNQAIQERLNKI